MFCEGDWVKLIDELERPEIGNSAGYVVAICSHCGYPVVTWNTQHGNYTREISPMNLIKMRR